MKRAVSVTLTLLFLVSLIALGRTIVPFIPQQLAHIQSFSGGFYVDWGVFWGIGAAVGIGGLIVAWARDNLEF